MHSNSSKISASLYAFTGVDPACNSRPKRSYRFGRGHGALHSPSWAVERGEEPISGRFYLRAPEPVELAAHDLVMVIEKITPVLIAQVRRSSRGIDNVGEENSGQDSIRIGRRSMPSYKFLDIVEWPYIVLAKSSSDPRLAARGNADREACSARYRPCSTVITNYQRDARRASGR